MSATFFFKEALPDYRGSGRKFTLLVGENDSHGRAPVRFGSMKVRAADQDRAARDVRVETGQTPIGHPAVEHVLGEVVLTFGIAQIEEFAIGTRLAAHNGTPSVMREPRILAGSARPLAYEHRYGIRSSRSVRIDGIIAEFLPDTFADVATELRRDDTQVKRRPQWRTTTNASSWSDAATSTPPIRIAPPQRRLQVASNGSRN